MADDGLERFQAMLGAISRIASGDEAANQLEDATCPKCGASAFIKVSDLYDGAVRRVNNDTANDEPRPEEAGLTDRRILENHAPPGRQSLMPRVVAFIIPLAVGVFFLYRRFGENGAEAGGLVAVVATVVFALTSARKLSDRYYARRARWNKAFMCRRCGQLVAP